MEDMAELWITIDKKEISWDQALASLKRVVDEARRKGYNVEVEDSVIKHDHVLAIMSMASKDTKSNGEKCDYDGIYYVFGRLAQEIVEKGGTTKFSLGIQRTGAS